MKKLALSSIVLVLACNTASAEKAFEIDALGMDLSAPEIAAITSSIQSAREISKRAQVINGLPYRRDAHAKATGCVRATFSINGDIPPQYRFGVFSQPARQYDAWIRFSNGDMLVQPDSKGDARGMAVKVMGVSGERIAAELSGPKTQDFIMTNVPAFFNRNIFDYADDMTYLAKFERTKWFISLFPPRLHPKQFYRAVQTVSSKITTPLAPQYYSMLPYQLGTTALKFSTRACPGMQFPKEADSSNPDFLSQHLSAALDKGAACFDFMVQPRVPGAYMPIDDATVVWKEKASPFIPIARINIPPQETGTQALGEFCEDLSMNPWHGVGEWLPMGSLNKARRVVYNAVSQYRHQQNKVATAEPTSWCIAGEGTPCQPDQGLHLSKSTWPLPRCFDAMFKPVDGSDPHSSCPGDHSYAASERAP